LPQFVVGLVVASGNATGEMPAQIGGHSPQVIMEDYVVPKGGSLAVSWGGDTDLRKGWVAGHLLLHRASNEMTITQYNLYWRLAAGGRSPLVGSIPAIGHTVPHCLQTTCPLINVTSIAGGGYRFDRDNYENYERAMIKVSGPGWVTVTRFDTEWYYDVLTVASERISGKPPLPMTVQLPEGLTTITWFSDYSQTATGWTFDLFQSDSTAEFQLNTTQAVGPGLEVVAAYGSTELPEGVFVGVTDYYSDMPPPPAFAVEAIGTTITEEQRVVRPPASAAERAKGGASLPRSRVMGVVTVPALDVHALSAESLFREAIVAAIAGVLPHVTKESVEILRITTEAGQMTGEMSPAATVEFQVALLGGMPAKAVHQIEARLILLSLGGNDAARFNKDLLERLAGAGAELPADTHVQVAGPW